MRVTRLLGKAVAGVILFVAVTAAIGAEAPTPKEGDWVVKDFKFHTGETLPELRLHYTTLGDSKGEPVLILHGTTGSGTGMLGPIFGGELFGQGQPLDASRYFIILPDAIGTGKSSKPSDGLRAKFPQYNYDDNPSPGLDRIKATLLAINSADDERNPPELGVLDSEIKRVKYGRVLMIPGSSDTFGHGTTAFARFWKKELADLLQSAPRLSN